MQRLRLMPSEIGLKKRYGLFTTTDEGRFIRRSALWRQQAGRCLGGIVKRLGDWEDWED